MKTDKHWLLITGPPLVGKTTAIQRTIELASASLTFGGFLTIAHNNATGASPSRVFHLVTIQGNRMKEGPLVTPGLIRPTGLPDTTLFDLVDFERRAVRAVEHALAYASVVVMDELGFLQLSSAPFRRVLHTLARQDMPVLATCSSKPGVFSSTLRSVIPDEKYMEFSMTEANRCLLPEELACILYRLVQRRRERQMASRR